MNYNKAFSNFGKKLGAGFHPDEVGQTPDGTPQKIEVQSETLSVENGLRVGSIAGYSSERLLDKKDHFPIITQTQAHSSMARVVQLAEVPSWYNGSLSELRLEVYGSIAKMHPGIILSVKVPIDQVVALSDGEIPASTSVKEVKDPEADRKKDMVPQVARPTLSSAEVEAALLDDDNRKAVAGRLMEMIDKQIEHMQSAKKVGERLLKGGMKSEEFDQLSTYVQEDILRELMSRGVTASTQAEVRRRELLERMQDNN